MIAIFRHNKLRDNLAESFHRAHLSVQVEVGSGFSIDLSQTRPAYVLVMVMDWNTRSAAFDICVVSPFNINTLSAAAASAEVQPYRQLN